MKKSLLSFLAVLPFLFSCTTPQEPSSSEPSSEPSSQPTSEPSSQPSSEPSSQPTSEPSSEPSSEPFSGIPSVSMGKLAYLQEFFSSSRYQLFFSFEKKYDASKTQGVLTYDGESFLLEVGEGSFFVGAENSFVDGAGFHVQCQYSDPFLSQAKTDVSFNIRRFLSLEEEALAFDFLEYARLPGTIGNALTHFLPTIFPSSSKPAWLAAVIEEEKATLVQMRFSPGTANEINIRLVPEALGEEVAPIHFSEAGLNELSEEEFHFISRGFCAGLGRSDSFRSSSRKVLTAPRGKDTPVGAIVNDFLPYSEHILLSAEQVVWNESNPKAWNYTLAGRRFEGAYISEYSMGAPNGDFSLYNGISHLSDDGEYIFCAQTDQTVSVYSSARHEFVASYPANGEILRFNEARGSIYVSIKNCPLGGRLFPGALLIIPIGNWEAPSFIPLDCTPYYVDVDKRGDAIFAPSGDQWVDAVCILDHETQELGRIITSVYSRDFIFYSEAEDAFYKNATLLSGGVSPTKFQYRDGVYSYSAQPSPGFGEFTDFGPIVYRKGNYVATPSTLIDVTSWSAPLKVDLFAGYNGSSTSFSHYYDYPNFYCAIIGDYLYGLKVRDGAQIAVRLDLRDLSRSFLNLSLPSAKSLFYLEEGKMMVLNSSTASFVCCDFDQA